MTYKFTNSAKEVMEIANETAIELGHDYIGTEHILYGLICEEEGVAGKVLEKLEIAKEEILEGIEELIGRAESENTATLGFTNQTI